MSIGWKRVCKASLSSVRARHWLSQRGKDESIRPACYAKGCWGDMWRGSSAEFQPLCWFQPKLFSSQSFPKSEIWIHIYIFTVSINSWYTVINTNSEIKKSSLDVLKETYDQNYGWTPLNRLCCVKFLKKYCFQNCNGIPTLWGLASCKIKEDKLLKLRTSATQSRHRPEQ